VDVMHPSAQQNAGNVLASTQYRRAKPIFLDKKFTKKRFFLDRKSPNWKICARLDQFLRLNLKLNH